MSTKIYNGYRSKLSMQKLLPELKKFVIQEKVATKARYVRSLLYESIRVFDLLPTLNFQATLVDTFIKHKEEIKDISDHEYHHLTHSVSSLILIPRDNDVLILLFCSDLKIKKVFSELLFIDDYSYWNNTDRPDDISEQDWNNRGKDWEVALGGDGYGKPIDNGYSFNIISKGIPIGSWRQIVKDYPQWKTMLPTDEERIETIVVDRETSKILEIDSTKTSDKISRVLKLIGDVRKKYGEGEYRTDDVVLRTINFDNQPRRER